MKETIAKWFFSECGGKTKASLRRFFPSHLKEALQMPEQQEHDIILLPWRWRTHRFVVRLCECVMMIAHSSVHTATQPKLSGGEESLLFELISAVHVRDGTWRGVTPYILL